MYFWFCVLAVLAGTLVPLQAGLNAQLRLRLDSPHYATLVSVVVSLLGITLFCLVARLPMPNPLLVARVPWWVWTGGIVGVVYVFMVLILAPKLGATALIASIIGGQVLCSVVLDHWGLIGFSQHPLNAGRLVGIALLFGGVILIQRS
jgi:transporter family-2 protein